MVSLERSFNRNSNVVGLLLRELCELNAKLVEMETGNFQTLASVLASNPAIVAQKGFIDEIFKSLTEYLKKMHAEGVYQLCLAPESIFVHKGSSVPMVLTQGSFFQGSTDLSALYDLLHRTEPENDAERHIKEDMLYELRSAHGWLTDMEDIARRVKEK